MANSNNGWVIYKQWLNIHFEWNKSFGIILFGHGIRGKNIKTERLYFSERNNIRPSMRIKNWYIGTYK